ncbi:hypothetical protein P153DRAFT_382368 [Dothidotthia symphoricarpi CBS 119687]|uniref:Uncharacterized protein n=1 Tax=Dothidotthia symphoricarpi CBS 119687 TaxID=1392245 RepID=A0A6A6ANW7_9PLEO|nr:uncharacterized protein P153DRAFT_382368 [Dothidotthia symphoricarpi CBS 119687]KAF2132745.1 hypothetical protein P153DRAFT_382368 [Dothidotthia symphoricarpi CBS 119687]
MNTLILDSSRNVDVPELESHPAASITSLNEASVTLKYSSPTRISHATTAAITATHGDRVQARIVFFLNELGSQRATNGDESTFLQECLDNLQLVQEADNQRKMLLEVIKSANAQLRREKEAVRSLRMAQWQDNVAYADLQTKLDDRTHELQAATDTVAERESEIVQLNGAYDELKTEFDSVKRELNVSRLELLGTKRANDANVAAAVATLQQQLDQATLASETKTGGLEVSLARTAEKARSLQQELDQVVQDRDALQAVNADLSESLQSTASQYQDCVQERDEAIRVAAEVGDALNEALEQEKQRGLTRSKLLNRYQCQRNALRGLVARYHRQSMHGRDLLRFTANQQQEQTGLLRDQLSTLRRKLAVSKAETVRMSGRLQRETAERIHQAQQLSEAKVEYDTSLQQAEVQRIATLRQHNTTLLRAQTQHSVNLQQVRSTASQERAQIEAQHLDERRQVEANCAAMLQQKTAENENVLLQAQGQSEQHAQQLSQAEAKVLEVEKTYNTAKKSIHNREKRVWHVGRYRRVVVLSAYQGTQGDAVSAEEMQLAVRELDWDLEAPNWTSFNGAFKDANTIFHSIREV